MYKKLEMKIAPQMGGFHQPEKKIPEPTKSIRGFPFFILKIFGWPQSSKAVPNGSGRSSDFPALLAAFPSRSIETVAHKG